MVTFDLHITTERVHQMSKGQSSQRRIPDGFSNRFVIIAYDPQTRKETEIAVRARFGGEEVTEEMVDADVKALNYNACFGGLTGKKIEKRRSVYRLLVFH